MRGTLLTLLLTTLALSTGCISHPDPTPLPPPEKGSIAGGDDPQPPSTPTTPKPAATPKKLSTIDVLQESVYVLMLADDGEDFMCTGTLVSKNRVVTAGHCLEQGRFSSYEVVAPLAPGKPRVKASNPTPMSNDFDDVSEPDFGFLTLDEPIELEHFGILTDVSAQVEKGDTLKAATAVRSAEKPEAPLKAVDGLELKSTTADGYDHGFGVKLFSHGGDSGAGLFLVEGGQTSHKLIGVARQPDFDTDTDMITRIDAEIIAWYRENSGE